MSGAASVAATPAAPGATRCPSCRRAMQVLDLSAHYGRRVEIDLCPACHLLWFDGTESVRLSGRGVLDVLRAIQASHGQAHEPLASTLACPRCETRLQRSANLTALGPTAHHECPRGHGAAQSFSLYLAEKGFLRPLYRPEVEQLRKRPEDRQVYFCLNCGAPLDPRSREACSFCASPVQVVDVLPLLRAVDRQTGQLGAGSATTGGLKPMHHACPHCGAQVDLLRDRRCESCTMPVALSHLGEALRLIEPLAPAVEAGQATPELRRRRLAESLDGAPTGLPPSRPAHGYQHSLWVYFAAAGVMLLLGMLAVWVAR
ncbi:hypothetical protein [Ramlibacter sp.]|uniref:TFIIB-type zinc ribbon-containing protein n=1 Tax=Ramlibacter sp. TaxID=1917967 RepID=UPI0035B0C2F9